MHCKVNQRLLEVAIREYQVLVPISVKCSFLIAVPLSGMLVV